MNRDIVWTWAAEADMQGIFAAAEDAADGTGVSLLGQVEKATTLLLNFPRMAPAWRGPVRRLMMKHQCLGLFYVPEPRRMVIIAVADLRRDPDSIWNEIRSRIP